MLTKLVIYKAVRTNALPYATKKFRTKYWTVGCMVKSNDYRNDKAIKEKVKEHAK